MVTHFFTQITAENSLVTLAQAKKQLRIEADSTDEDELIQACIEASQEACQNYINRAIAEQNFVMHLDVFPDTIGYERNYLNDTIEKIEYYAPGETELTTLDPALYKLKNSNIVECFDIKFGGVSSAVEMPATDKREDAVVITVKQGFDVSTCPKPIIQAIKLRLTAFYEYREDRPQGFDTASNNLLRAYRKY